MRFGCWLVIFFISMCIITMGAITLDNILSALVPLATGILCFLLSIQTKKDIAKIKNIHTYKVKDIIELRNIVKQEVGRESYFSMPVAVQGTKKIGNNFEGDQFYVEDGTGEILVKLDRLSSVTNNNRKQLLKDNKLTSTQTLKSVKKPVPVYVIGEAIDKFGELVIQNSKDKKENFMIIFKSKKQYIEQKQSHSKWFILIGVFFTLFGFIAIVALSQPQQL